MAGCRLYPVQAPGAVCAVVKAGLPAWLPGLRFVVSAMVAPSRQVENLPPSSP